MKIRLPESWIGYTLPWPESGMGYVRVDVQFADGAWLRDVPIFNAEEIDLPESRITGPRLACIILDLVPHK